VSTSAAISSSARAALPGRNLLQPATVAVQRGYRTPATDTNALTDLTRLIEKP
jgi:hypothetical protein